MLSVSMCFLHRQMESPKWIESWKLCGVVISSEILGQQGRLILCWFGLGYPVDVDGCFFAEEFWQFSRIHLRGCEDSGAASSLPLVRDSRERVTPWSITEAGGGRSSDANQSVLKSGRSRIHRWLCSHDHHWGSGHDHYPFTSINIH